MHNTLVAVYGTLREGHGNHRLLEGSKYHGTEQSVPEFTLNSLGGLPALTAGEGEVVIELYEVDDATFSRLDQLEGYPDFYDRRVIPTSRGEAWVYFMHDLSDRWHSEVIKSGDWSVHRGIGE